MSSPLISVLMPCKNADSTVAGAVESILNQSLDDFELLIWDDGSTDETPRILADLTTADSRVRIVGNEPVGLVDALHRLGECARGQFIARMDADDISLSERFEQQIDYLHSNPWIALCGCLYETIGGPTGSGRTRYDTWINSVTPPEAIWRELFVECPVPHPSFMMRTEDYHAVGGYQDHGWPEDYDLVFRVAAAGRGIGKVPQVLLHWRYHPGQTSLTHERYTEAQFRALKRHYLPRIHGARLDRLYQWGAGEVGKRWLREWTQPRPEAVVDIHPRKVGIRIHGYRIVAPEELPPPGTAFTVVMVGAPGAREDIRAWFTPLGYHEGDDYVFMA